MAREKLQVIDGDQRVPFLRGMLTHSLIEKGLDFQQAYDTARQVRDRIRPQKSISRSELKGLIDLVLVERFGPEFVNEIRTLPRPLPILRVQGEDGTVPFSKSTLAQSLQAAGLEPATTHEIAQAIEQRLATEEQQEIGHHELRRLVFETLVAEQGARVAERYLLWRYFQTPDRPLIILFGGATGVGKTTLANEVAHRLGIQRMLSTDTVRQIMRIMFSRDLLPAIHYSSYEAWKEWKFPGVEPEASVVEAFREQSLRVLAGVRAMIERAIQENFSLIIDGVHLIPGLGGLREFENRAYLVQLVISTLNRRAYLERFPVRQAESGHRPAARYRKNFDRILQIQDYILEMAELQEVPIFENDDFDQTVVSILTVIANSLREKLELSSEELIARAL